MLLNCVVAEWKSTNSMNCSKRFCRFSLICEFSPIECKMLFISLVSDILNTKHATPMDTMATMAKKMYTTTMYSTETAAMYPMGLFHTIGILWIFVNERYVDLRQHHNALQVGNNHKPSNLPHWYRQLECLIVQIRGRINDKTRDEFRPNYEKW